MGFLNSLRLNLKLQTLLGVITFGLIFIASIGYMNISSMKKNLDDVYFGSLIPVIELNEIVSLYNNNLELPIYLAMQKVTTAQNAVTQMQEAINQIDVIWARYISRYKSDSELEYIKGASREIKKTNQYYKKIINYLQAGLDPAKLSALTLSKNTKIIKSTIKKIADYEVNSASYDRKKLLLTYNSLIKQLSAIFALTVLAVLFVASAIFRSIHKQQVELEDTTQKLKSANSKLKTASYKDSLTGLSNRRYFNKIYEREIKRAIRDKTYFTFMMLDIDFFKQYNDTYGHLEGDNALKMVANALNLTMQRPSDYVFRLGGEEFGVILTDTDKSNSAIIAQKINRNIEGMKLAHEKNRASDYVTISIGVVCVAPTKSMNVEALLSHADDNLYKAKDSGRNRYVLSSNF
ncbi:MAG: diguanylate cyclase [Campylobacterota bacterium]|nr:diguanylate cyclase [Campylobacterota bacterium]